MADMHTRREAIGLLFYLGAATVAFIFLKDVFKEYNEGKSSFHTSYRDILAEDIPVITFCFWPGRLNEPGPDTSPKFGQDITIKYR